MSLYPQDDLETAPPGSDWARQLKSLLGPVPRDPPRPAYDLTSMLPPAWRAVLPEDLEKQPYWRSLSITLRWEYENNTCIPRLERIFRPLWEINPDDVRVIILDEAPSEIAADGLAFSCSDAPPSGGNFTGSKTLQTILEVVSNTMITANKTRTWVTQETLESGEKPLLSLLHWAKQGVLLWNMVATARIDRRGNYCTVNRESHWNLSGGSWQHFTFVLINSLTHYLAKKSKSVGFMLFGNRAKALVHNRANTIKTNPEWVTSHPAPRTCTESFVGTDCFLTCNRWLEDSGQTPIAW